MKIKKDTKIYLKFNTLTLLTLFLLFYSTIFVQRVSADFENSLPKQVYDTAWQIINEKFYFKSGLNLDGWQNKFENRINDLDDAHHCINKLIKVLNDPYTRFLTKDEFKDEQDIINSTLVGIGIKLSNKKPIILEILPDSPAEIEDIRPNDFLLAVNNQTTHNLSTNEVVNLLRGSKGTLLTITLKRENNILNKTLVREELKLNPVSSKMLENNIALIKIDSFISENTSKLFKDELIKLMSVNGIILDLRNNSGGLLKNAIEIADMFLSEGRIVSTVNNSVKINEYANSSKIFDSEIVILVNENTASASEILTSALKENKIATVIGERTYGKGLVQEVVKLPDESALHVTVASYLTPNGTNLNKTGITPDEIVYSNEKQIERAKEILLKIASL